MRTKVALISVALLFALASLSVAARRPTKRLGVTSNHYEDVTTTNSTQTLLVQTNLPEDCAQSVHARVIARNTSTGAVMSWDIVFMSKRVGSNDSVIVGSPVGLITPQGDLSMVLCSVAVDTDSDQVRILVAGLFGTTIDWYGEYLGLQLYP